MLVNHEVAIEKLKRAHLKLRQLSFLSWKPSPSPLLVIMAHPGETPSLTVTYCPASPQGFQMSTELSLG